MSKKKSIWCVVLVVNYGSHELIARNFSTLPRREDGVAMVVVDNFSTEAERREIGALCEERGWDLVASGINLGFGTGVNLGVDYALDLDPETIVLLNPDAVIEASGLRQLADAVREDEQRLVCPRIEDTAGKVFFAGALLDMQTGGTLGASSPKRRADGVYREWLTGACLAFAPSLWNKLGGFSDDYFLYWEDVDFSFRAVHAGAELHYAPHILVVHDEGGTQQAGGQRAKSEVYYYYNIRNRMLFARTWLTGAEQSRWIRGSLRASWDVILRGGRRQLLGSLAPWRALVRGLYDGLRDARGPKR